MELSRDERIRYARHIAIPEFGVNAQQRLKSANVLVIGSGGLGSPAILYLAAAGVGTLGIVEYDQVDISNLQRQILYTEADIGADKIDIAAQKVFAINSKLNIVKHAEKLTSVNALEILSPYDIVIDATDNFPARYLINDACVLLKIPLVYGAIHRYEGQVAVFNAKNIDGLRSTNYRDLYPRPPAPELSPNCAEAGVIGVLPGMIGSMQASEAIKVITGVGEPLINKLFLLDAFDMSTRIIKIKKNPEIIIDRLINYDDFCGLKENNNDMIKSITVQDLKKMVDDKADFQLIDVREKREYDFCNLDGLLIPLGSVMDNVGQISKDKKVIVHCRSGARSGDAIHSLQQQHGFENLYNLEGGILAWSREIDPSIPQY